MVRPTAVHSNDLHRFSLAEREWARLNTTGDVPTARFGAGLAYTGGGLYLFGGVDETRGSNARVAQPAVL